jgi:hypothetical protein
MNGLMVAFAFTLPYHVMRVAHAAGIRVHVFGGDASRGLKMSRCCRAYHEMPFAGDPEALLAEIGEVVRATRSTSSFRRTMSRHGCSRRSPDVSRHPASRCRTLRPSTS